MLETQLNLKINLRKKSFPAKITARDLLMESNNFRSLHMRRGPGLAAWTIRRLMDIGNHDNCRCFVQISCGYRILPKFLLFQLWSRAIIISGSEQRCMLYHCSASDISERILINEYWSQLKVCLRILAKPTSGYCN